MTVLKNKEDGKSAGFFTTLLSVFKTFKHRKTANYSLLICSLFMVIGTLIEPLFFREIIDNLILFETSAENKKTSIMYTLLVWLCIGVGVILLKLYISIFSDRFSHEMYNENFLGFYKHVLDLSMRFHGDIHSGALLKKLTRGTDGIFWVQLNTLRKIIPNLFTLIILIPTVLYLNLYFGLVIVAVGIIFGGIAVYSIRHTFSQQDSVEKYHTRSSKVAGDSFSNIALIKSFGLSRSQYQIMQEIFDERLQKQYPVLNWWGFLMSFSQITSIIITLGIFFYGSHLYFEGLITIGEIVMFLGFSSILLSTIESIMWDMDSIFWQITRVKEFMEILDTAQEIKDVEGAKKFSKIKGEVEFRDIGFAYTPDKKILHDINFSIKPGEKIALVGHTGSGKTTTSNLLLRFFDPQSGKILIDGKNIADYTQDSLRDNIACVFQESFLFDETVKTNIALNNTNISQQRLEEISKKSHAWEFIKDLPKGFDTVVGERGVKLSGGEKQRVAIARAFLKDAPILILDEATSALDAQTEQILQTSFDELMIGRTTFIIAHRLSTIKGVDRILVFDHGRIIEQGTYKDLVNTGGAFSKLVESQVKGFID